MAVDASAELSCRAHGPHTAPAGPKTDTSASYQFESARSAARDRPLRAPRSTRPRGEGVAAARQPEPHLLPEPLRPREPHADQGHAREDDGPPGPDSGTRPRPRTTTGEPMTRLQPPRTRVHERMYSGGRKDRNCHRVRPRGCRHVAAEPRHPMVRGTRRYMGTTSSWSGNAQLRYLYANSR